MENKPMPAFTKEALNHELPLMREQLIWAIKNFYKDPINDFALVWLSRILFWNEEIEHMKELCRTSPSENEDMT